MLEINTNPSRTDLRWFGLIFGAVFAIVGGVVWLKTALLFGMGSAPTLASLILWAVAAVVPIVYYAIPPLRRRIYVGFMIAVFPIGWVISNLVLAITYYLVLTPIGLAMRLLGHDPMHRTLLPEARTYWHEHRTGGDPARYFKQF